jgi:hypothetical protein
MIKSGYNNLNENKNYIEFPSDSEAYKYAEDNDISIREIYFRGGYWRIDLPESLSIMFLRNQLRLVNLVSLGKLA